MFDPQMFKWRFSFLAFPASQKGKANGIYQRGHFASKSGVAVGSSTSGVSSGLIGLIIWSISHNYELAGIQFS